MEVKRKLLLDHDSMAEEAMKRLQDSFPLLVLFLHERVRELLRLLDEIKRRWVELGLTTNVVLITGAVILLLFLLRLCCCRCFRGGGQCSGDGKGGGKMGRLRMARVFIGNEAVEYFRVRLRCKKEMLC